MKIISGGQTGIDQYALEIAKELGFSTGGTACKDWMTEDGIRPDLERYGLQPCYRSGYPARTVQNVKDSTLTVILTPSLGAGSKLTLNTCKREGIPCLVNPDSITKHIAGLHEPIVINFAGSRASRLSESQKLYYRQRIYDILKELL